MSASANHLPVRPDWLAQESEEALDPGQLIIDAHHHLYERPGLRYLLQDYLADLATGHNVRASVFVQARAMLPIDIDPDLQPIGEVEFANGVAAMSASGIYGPMRVCAGIVGFADLTLGDRVRPLLERMVAAGGGAKPGGGRLRGVRQTLCWDKDATLLNSAYPTTEFMVDEPMFRAGFRHLAALGLSFDAWAFFPQLSNVASLARAFPDTPIVVNHCGGIVRTQAYARRRDVYQRWRAGIGELASCPNVSIKISGLGMKIGGFAFDVRATAPSSEELADAWRPWIETCVEEFGANRCMYGSNFPVDKGSYNLSTGVNAIKRLIVGASRDEKDAIFHRTAQAFYRLA